MEQKLAIVIPAYKGVFFEKALKSLANQTCKDFVVYVGDDTSPSDLHSIVEKYNKSIEIVYKRFETNLGGSNLVAQWNRCIEMTSEPWLWLFSDDDVLDDRCVELFYNQIQKNVNHEFFHFNVNVIDEYGNPIEKSVFPQIMDAKEFVISKFRGKLKSFVVEYVFSRRLYNAIGGFQPYDLAWNADDATWLKMASEQGIYTIEGACVNWRKSALNISPNAKDSAIVRRKINADLSYVENVSSMFDGAFFNIKLSIFALTWFCVNMIKYRTVLSTKDQVHLVYECAKRIHKVFLFPFALLYLFLKKRFL